MDIQHWAIVELMGHVRLAGRLTEVERFGSKLGQLDIPTAEGGFVTQFFGGGSVYRITAVSEQVARDVAASNQPQPIHTWEYPKPDTALPASSIHSMPPPYGFCRYCDRPANKLEGGACHECSTAAPEPPAPQPLPMQEDDTQPARASTYGLGEDPRDHM
jgi:hypothetical protein